MAFFPAVSSDLFRARLPMIHEQGVLPHCRDGYSHLLQTASRKETKTQQTEEPGSSGRTAQTQMQQTAMIQEPHNALQGTDVSPPSAEGASGTKACCKGAEKASEGSIITWMQEKAQSLQAGTRLRRTHPEAGRAAASLGTPKAHPSKQRRSFPLTSVVAY